MRNSKRLLKFAVIALLFGFIALYAFYQARGIIAGPTIFLDEPENGMTTSLAVITVSGTILRSDFITLDGRFISVDLEGHFSERLLLMKGYNILTIKASDREGREAEKTIEIIRTEQ